MLRVLLIGLVVLIGIASASVLLVTGAEPDDESATSTEQLPLGDEPREQDAQQQSEPPPEPPEDDADAAEETDDAEPVAGDEADEGSAGESSDEEQEGVAVAESQEEPAAVVETATPDPADVVIKALDIERPRIVVEVDLTVISSTYTVEPGDTLSDIAGRFGITLEELIAVNELDSPDIIDVGLVLTIPGAEPVVESGAEPEPSFEPNEVAPVLAEEGVIYGTIHDHERGVVNTAVVFTSQSDPTVQLVEACVDGLRRTYLIGLQLSDGLTRLYWRIDGGALNTDRWRAADELLESTRWCPLLNNLEEATTLWVRAGGLDLTFGVENLGPAEIAHNFFICGR